MKTAALISVLGLALTALASPTAVARADVIAVARDASKNSTVDARTLSKRTLGGVLLCTDTNWNGDCGYKVQPLNNCIVLGSEWANKVSSFGPDECTRCDGYAEKDCSFTWPDFPPPGAQPAVWQFDFPGDSSGGLSTSNPWNDRLQSFQCVDVCQ